ncbi:hypothetical protein [Nonlabens marinus]|uniref:Uncharacterized protein n=1 Tax=Nonlabens marinus S1-08 TaxID=1454201 RepID=W8VQA8_9FLAO|nr:hypothetical protein [Nonlabens marinus]BAO54975.1 hypothetical protein NMS_0966 [Nonlabens marinus S1-08]
MAEIKIEKKKPVWPWILLAILVLAAIIYFFVYANDEDDMDDEVLTEQVMEGDGMDDQSDDLNTAAISQFETALENYSTYIGDTGQMSIDHEYSNGALLLLIDAVQAKADVHDVEVTADLREARESAKQIMENPYKVNHADLIKQSGGIITRALSTLQKEKFPNLTNELSAVEQNLADIIKSEKTLNQKTDVNTFFKAAESLLLKMK